MNTVINTSLKIWIFLVCISCNQDNPVHVESCEDKIENLKINQYQIIGSHNSYRKQTQQEIMGFMNASADLLPEGFDPAAWDYSHETLEDQLSIYGLRSLEFDVYRDPEGGLFKNRMGNVFVGLDPDADEEKLLSPGLKILHFPDFDYHTHVLTFVDALEEIKSWSARHPGHLPLTILVEAKEDNPALMLPGFGLTTTLNFSDKAVEEIENEINKVFAGNIEQILKPDDLRKNKSTLREAVMTLGWPSLAESRGKIIFVLMARDVVIDSYLENHSSLAGRNMFVFSNAEKDEAAFLNVNDPESNMSEIKKWLDQGFIVRTRADADTEQARTGSYARMKSAFSSGAQIISTDYYRPDPRSTADENWTDYQVAFENNKLAVIQSSVMEALAIECEIAESLSVEF